MEMDQDETQIWYFHDSYLVWVQNSEGKEVEKPPSLSSSEESVGSSPLALWMTDEPEAVILYQHERNIHHVGQTPNT